MAKNEIEYKVIIDVDGTAKIEKLAASTKSVPPLPKEVESSFSRLQASIVTANSALQLYAMAAQKVISTVSSMVTPFIELEKSVAQIGTIITETEKQQINFSKAITDTQKNFGANQADVAKAYYDAIGSGAVKASEATQFFDTANKLAIGGVTSLKNATDVLTSVMSAYGYEASQTGAISDILFIAARDGKTDIDQLSGAIGQALSIAKQMGVGFNELTASVSAVTLAGVSTSEATTSVRAAMVALTKPTEELQALYKDLGISSIQAEIGQFGLVNTLKKLTAASGGSSEGLVQLFGRVEALSAVTALTSDVIGSKFTAMYQSMQDGANNAGAVTTKAFEQMQQTSSFQVDLLKQRAQVALISLGTIFSGVGSDILTTLNNFMSGVISVFDNISNVIKNVDFQILIDGFYELQTAALIAGGAIAGWLAMTKGIDAVAAANGIKTLAAALYLQAKAAWAAVAPTVILAAKIILISAAIAIVVVAIDLIMRNLENLGDVFVAIGAKILEWVNSVAAMLSRLIAKISFFNKKWSALADEYSETAKDMSAVSKKASENVDWGGAGKILEFAQKAFGGTTEAVQKTEVATKSLQKTVAAAPTMPAPDPNTLKMYDALVEKIKSMELAVVKNQMTDKQYIDFASKKALDEVALVESKLQAEKRYTKERQANLDKLKGLIKAQAEEEKKAADVKFAAKVLDDQKKIADIMGNSVESNRIAMEQQSTQLKAMLDSNTIDVMQYHSAIEQLEKNHQDYILNLNGETATKLDAIMGTQTNTMLESFRKKREEIEKLAAKPIEAGGITQEQKGAALKQVDQQQAFAAPVAGVTDALAPATNLANGISGMVGGIANAAGGIVTAIAKIPQIFDGLIDMVDGALQAWLDFPTKIFDKFMASNEKLMQFPQKFLDNLGNSLPKISGYLTKSLVDTVPRLIGSLIKGIPKFITGLIQAIPAVFDALIDGLISSVLSIKDAFTSFVDPESWKLGEAATQAIDAVGKSVTGVGSQLFGFVEQSGVSQAQEQAKNIRQASKEGAGWFMKAWEQLKNFGLWVANLIGSSIMAGVNALQALLKFVGETFATLMTASIAIFENTVAFIGEQFNAVWELGKATFSTVIESFKWLFVDIIWGLVLKPFVDMVQWVFVDIVWKLVLKPAVDLFMAMWNFVVTLFDDPVKAFKELWESIKNIFADAWTNLLGAFTKLGDIFSSIWDKMKTAFYDAVAILGNFFGSIKTYVVDAFSSVIDFFSNLGATIWNALSGAWGNVRTFFTDLFTFTPSPGKVEDWLKFDFPWVSFAEGGLVGGTAKVAGDSLKNDTVPALLSAGEYILPRSVTQDKDLMALLMAIINSNKKVEKHATGGSIGDFFSKAGSTIWEGAKSVGSAVVEGAKWVGDLLVPDWIQELWDSLSRYVSNIDFKKFVQDPLPTAEKALKDSFGFLKDLMLPDVKKLLGFAQGGLVGSGTDTVPAMLTPGEYVVSRPAVEQYGVGALNALNKGMLGSGSTNNTTNNIELTLNFKTEQPIDEKYVKNVMMPTIKDELRRLSLDGRRVLASSGVR